MDIIRAIPIDDGYIQIYELSIYFRHGYNIINRISYRRKIFIVMPYWATIHYIRRDE